MTAQYKRLYRSRHDRMIGGVCGGLGDYFAIDPTLVRLLFVFGSLMGAQGLLVYLILMIVVPEQPAVHEVADPGAELDEQTV